MQRRPRERVTLTAAVITAFALILGLWLFVAYYLSVRMGLVEAGAAAVNQRYLQAQLMLASVQSRLLLGSVHVRDALLDSTTAHPGGYTRQLETTYDGVLRALDRYVPVGDTGSEQAHVELLRHQVEQLRTAAVALVDGDRTDARVDARARLAALMPQREAAMRLSAEVQGLAEAALAQQSALTASMHGALERQVWASLSLGVALSFGIAVLASAYARRLEGRVHAQRAREERAVEQLQHLSAALLDAQQEERRRIARELHDEVGQLLSAVKVELTLANQRVRNGTAASLADAEAIADTALHAVRDLSHLLHPSMLDDLGLVAALQSYSADHARRYGCSVDLLCDGLEHRLAPDVEAAVFRIVQESMRNVVRHAGATACQVRLQRTRDRLRITVADDGVGFPPDALPPADDRRRGLGLLSMHERAAQFGGTLQIESSRELGTTVTVELLLSARRSSPGGQAPIAAARDTSDAA